MAYNTVTNDRVILKDHLGSVNDHTLLYGNSRNDIQVNDCALLCTVSSDKKILLYNNFTLTHTEECDDSIYAVKCVSAHNLIVLGTLNKSLFFYDSKVGMVDKVSVGV